MDCPALCRADILKWRSVLTVNVLILGYAPSGSVPAILGYFYSTTLGYGGCFQQDLTAGSTITADALAAQIPAAITAWGMENLGVVPDSVQWCFTPVGNPTPKSFSSPSRALNTAFQPSAGMDTLGLYSVSIAASLSLTGGQNGSIVLEYADDSGFTTNVKTVAQSTNGNTGSLTIGLNTVQTQGAVLSGIIPASKYARLRTVNTTGTPTNASVMAQEVQM